MKEAGEVSEVEHREGPGKVFSLRGFYFFGLLASQQSKVYFDWQLIKLSKIPCIEIILAVTPPSSKLWCFSMQNTHIQPHRGTDA